MLQLFYVRYTRKSSIRVPEPYETLVSLRNPCPGQCPPGNHGGFGRHE